jgi:iron complex outermembrane receptor protein
LRAVVNAGFDQTNGKDQNSWFAASSGANNNVPFGTNEFSKVKEKQVAGCLFSVQQNIW